MFKNRSNRNKLQNTTISKLTNGIYCINCGKNNHTLLSCTEPHNSYGLLCFYRIDNELKLLMIRRKYTIPYMEFLRGKYDVNNFKYLVELFSKMTHHEIMSIVSTCSFAKLRTELGLNNSNNRQYKTEYETSELKFNYILNLGTLHKVIICINAIFGTTFEVAYELNFTIDKDTVIHDNQPIITSYKQDIQTVPLALYTDPEWGLPKGKREERESDLQTAIREFCEETGLHMYNLRIYKNVIPLEEQYTGINNICYRHTYFIAELINISPDVRDKLIIGYTPQNTDTYEQKTEVSKLMLLTQPDALNIIRPFHQNKKNIVHKAFYIMHQYKTFFN